MKSSRIRVVAAAAFAVILLALLTTTALPLIFPVRQLRPVLAREIGNALGRPVRVGEPHLSVWRRGLIVDGITVADDPAFSPEPLLHAPGLRVEVELLPLLLHQQLRLHRIVLQSAEVHLIRTAEDRWNFAELGRASGGDAGSVRAEAGFVPDRVALQNAIITVADAAIAGKPGPEPIRFTAVQLELRGFASGDHIAFAVSFRIPGGGGDLHANGVAGPLFWPNLAETPVRAEVSVAQLNLASSSFSYPGSALLGTASGNAEIISDGETLRTSGNAVLEGLRLTRDGDPSPVPVALNFTVTHPLRGSTMAHVEGATLSGGHTLVHLEGSYGRGAAAVARLDLRLHGEAMPVDELSLFLPALGLHPPAGSTLTGGTVATSMAISGTIAAPVLDGEFTAEGTRLPNFDLRSRLQGIVSLPPSKPGAAGGVEVRLLHLRLHAAGEDLRAEILSLDLPPIGTVTGAGTVSATSNLSFDLQLTPPGAIAGIPIRMGGTTANPTFAPGTTQPQ